jgi:hypothetical protein
MQENKFPYMTITQTSKKWEVSRQRIMDWILCKRIEIYMPAIGVRLISVNAKRPEKMRPWEKERKTRLSYET